MLTYREAGWRVQRNTPAFAALYKSKITFMKILLKGAIPIHEKQVQSRTWQYTAKNWWWRGQLWAEWVLRGRRDGWGLKWPGRVSFKKENLICALKGGLDMMGGAHWEVVLAAGTAGTKARGRDAGDLCGWVMCVFLLEISVKESWAALGKTGGSLRPGRGVWS